MSTNQFKNINPLDRYPNPESSEKASIAAEIENTDFSESQTPVDSQAPSFIDNRKAIDVEAAASNGGKHTIPSGASSKEEQLDQQNTSLEPPLDEPPPDGGTKAWLQVLGAHAIVMVTWGYTTSFGFFQAHYLDILPSSTPADISWIGSMQLFSLFFVGTFSGAALDIGYHRWLILGGSMLLLLGIFMTSLATTYYQLFLAHGVCVGLANGCLFVPTLAVVTTYFSTRRGIAIGLMACGAATGGMILPAIIIKTLPTLGFPTTIRILGGVVAGLLCFAGLIIRPRIPPRKTSRGFIDKSVFKDYAFGIFALGMFFLFLALMTPFFYISTFARLLLEEHHQSSTSSNLPTTLIIIMNAAGIPGRLISARIADKLTGPYNSLIPFTFLTSIIIFSWIRVTTIPALYIFVVFYGYSAAAILTLFPYTMNSRITPLNRLGVVSGMVASFVSFAFLFGAPVAGALMKFDQDVNGRKGVETFRSAQVFSGCMALLAGGLLIVSRALMTKGKLFVWI